MLRTRVFASPLSLLLLAGLSACLAAPDEGEGGAETTSLAAARGAPTILGTASQAADIELDEPDPSFSSTPRGFGTMTGRLPGTNTTVAGVRLLAHSVRVTLRDGFARTEIEEEFANDTDRVLEGRYVFPLPPDASLSRLALWVNEDLVEGEMVERERAARIFQGIVDDTVRPRDPALLEWTRGSSFSLKIFPMPAHKTRKVLLAYDEVLHVEGGRARYTYPLSLGGDRAVTMDDFRIHITVEDARGMQAEAKVLGHPATLRTEEGRLEADFQAEKFVPKGDFILEYPRPTSEVLPVAVEGGDNGKTGFYSLRIPVAPPVDTLTRAPRNEKIFVIDASHGITKEGLAAEVAVTEGILRRLGSDDRFSVLLCDSACTSYPLRGLAAPLPETLAEASRFLHERAPFGASDAANALVEGLSRVSAEGHGQILYFGDGAPSAGELKVDTIAARVKSKLEEKRAELRFFGAGPSIDEMVLGGLAETLSASYERLATGETLARRAAAISKSLASPLLSGVHLELPPGFSDVYPRHIPALRVGEELVVVGRFAGATGSESETVRLSGSIEGEPLTWSHKLGFSAAPGGERNMLARRWATARIQELGQRSDDAAAKETIDLSLRFHVQSRLTSLLVLENDSMFAAFGIPRTQGKGALSAAAEMGAKSDFGGKADTIGEAFGPGGLGLSGVGEGGGGIGQGFGAGHGRLGGDHKSSSPRVRMGGTTVSGRLPPEIVQRIVRQNFGRFRLCYENGLRSNPGLAGRVTIRFVIGRDGAVTAASNGGSDLPDANVIACIQRAFANLAFPQPEGGIVTVTYPIMFSSGNDSPVRSPSSSPWPPPGSGIDVPRSWIGKGEETWRDAGKDTLARLAKDVLATPESRRARESLITSMLARGRFEEAYREAQTYVSLDPDRARPHELVAQSAGALGQFSQALSALDAEAELDPLNADMHRRAARAFEAALDEKRACAHFRAWAELRPNDEDATFESLRCSARVLGERDAALAAIAAMKNPAKRFVTLREALEKGELPAYKAGEPGGERISAKLTCAEGVEGCPRVLLLDPAGRIISPLTPSAGRSGATWIALPWASSGTYRVLVTGGLEGARGELVVRLDDITKKFEVSGGEGARTAAIVSVAE